MTTTHEIPARAGDAGAALNPRIMGVSLNSPAVLPCAAGAFWATLSPAEDVLLWDMRRLGVPFPLIAAEIETRREKAERGRRGGLKRWARHYRDQIRRERAQ